MRQAIQIFILKFLFRKFNDRRIGTGKALKLINTFGKFDFQLNYQSLKFLINSTDKYWLKYMISGKPYEPEIELLLRSLNDSIIFIDVGANIGYWSIFVKGKFNDSIVMAVEPNPERFQYLKQNVLINDLDIATLQCGISNKSETNHFFVSEDITLHAGASKIRDNLSNPSEIIIEYKTLDDLLNLFPNSTKNIVIKLDVEGEEYSIIKSSSLALERNAIFIFEQHGQDICNDAARFFLDSNRYNLYLLTEEGPIQIEDITTLKNFKIKKEIGYNCLAAPQESAQAIRNQIKSIEIQHLEAGSRIKNKLNSD